MVRYNRIEKWMMLNISNTDLTEKEYEQEFDYYERTTKDLQAKVVCTSIPAEGKGGWFIQHILWALSEDNFRVHLFNLRLHMCGLERVPDGESGGEAAARLLSLAQFKSAYDTHKAHWVDAILDAINKEQEVVAAIPPSNQANLVRIREV
jgi:hypothetical protein